MKKLEKNLFGVIILSLLVLLFIMYTIIMIPLMIEHIKLGYTQIEMGFIYIVIAHFIGSPVLIAWFVYFVMSFKMKQDIIFPIVNGSLAFLCVLDVILSYIFIFVG